MGSQPVRILHVVKDMRRDGAETMIMNVYRRLDRSRVQFDFAVSTGEPAAYDEEIKELGGRIFPHPEPSEAGFSAYRGALSRTINNHGPFAGLHSHVFFFSGYVLKIAALNRVPLRLAHSHNTQDGREDSPVRKVYRRVMVYLIRKHATHLLGCSRAACRALYREDCFDDPRVRVVPNAVDPEKFRTSPGARSAIRKLLSLPPDEPVIVNVARFHPQKNHRFLVDVFSNLLRRLPQAHLLLVGDGELRPEIERYAASRGTASRVRFLGARDDVPSILSGADLFLLPSLYEGIPLVLVEAQTAGLPCVVSSTVTSEVDLKIGLVRFVGLNNKADLWAEEILRGLSAPPIEWDFRFKAVRDAGYDVRESAKTLERIYCGEINN